MLIIKIIDIIKNEYKYDEKFHASFYNLIEKKMKEGYSKNDILETITTFKENIKSEMLQKSVYSESILIPLSIIIFACRIIRNNQLKK